MSNKSKLILCSILISAAIFLFLPAVQNLLIIFGGKIIGRPLNYPEIWKSRLIMLSFSIFTLAIMLFLSEIQTNRIVEDKITKYFPPLIIFFLSLSTAICFFNFFPLYIRYGIDKSVFLYIGKMMTKGMIPYKELFDHKGIVLYFIQYFSALLFPNSTTGVWLFELCCIFITYTFSYKIVNLFIKSTSVCLMTIFVIYFYMGSKCYDGGNLTEEYALPCISFAYYIFLKFFKETKYKIFDIFLLGITFAIVSLLRINMAVCWIFFTPIILIKFIIEQRFLELIKCIGAFLFGSSIVLVPCLFYCIKTNCLNDFWNDYILFNFLYTSKGSLQSRFSFFLYVFKTNIIGCICILLYIYTQKKEKTLLLNLLFFFFTLLFASLSGRQDTNYLIFLLPIYSLPIATTIDKLFLVNKFKIGNIAKRLAIYTSIIFVGINLISISRKAMQKPKNNNIAEEFILHNTLPNDDILILGNFAELYLKTERYSSNKYFYQYPPLAYSKEFQDDFCHIIQQKKHDYIFLLENLESYKWINITNSMPNVIKTIENLVANGDYEKTSYKDMIVYSKK